MAEGHFEGPADKYGAPKISNDALDIEVKFSKEGPTMYRWVWDSATLGAYVGQWRESRRQAFDEGERWVKGGRL